MNRFDNMSINFFDIKEEEFGELEIKYPTGHYTDSKGTNWFELTIDHLRITWFR